MLRSLRRFIPCLLLGTLEGGCGGDGGQSPLPAQEPVPVRFGAISLVLDGAFAPYLRERTAAAPEATREFPADVLCISQVMRTEDKAAIAQSSAGAFPYNYWAETDLQSEPSDPRAADGSVPARPDSPPCGTADLEEQARRIADCVAAQCSTVAGSDEGYLSDGGCAVQSCVTEFSQLLFGDDAAKRCFSCVLYTGMSERIRDIVPGCSQDPRAGFAFEGKNGMLILSRYPLSGTDAWVLPSTAWREVVLSATVSPPGASPVDVHCVTLQGPHNSVTQPYTGLYSAGQGNDQAWSEESKLQARRTVERVLQRSGSRPAVIWGDFYVGPEVTADGAAALVGVIPEAFQVLSDAFREAVPEGYGPVCTTCGENPINDGSADWPSAWTAHVQTLNVPVTTTLRTERFAVELVTEVEKAGTSPTEILEIPVSPRYGLVSEILLP